MVQRELTAGRAHLFRPSPIFLGLVALTATGGVLAYQRIGSIQFNIFLMVVAGWLVSLSLHEYAHASLAYLAGDRSVAHRGYLTLNPLKYAHPVLSILLPVVFLLLGGIGLPGGAVWLDRHAVRSKRAASLISLAGPLTNLALAVALTIPFLLGIADQTHIEFWAGVALLGFLQLTAALLNLVPIPGLDGGNSLRPYLQSPWDRRFDLFAPWGMLLLVALLFTEPVGSIFFWFVSVISDLIGLPYNLATDVGLRLFQFWR